MAATVSSVNDRVHGNEPLHQDGNGVRWYNLVPVQQPRGGRAQGPAPYIRTLPRHRDGGRRVMQDRHMWRP